VFGEFMWLGGHAPRLRSRPERASDMHRKPQTPKPACLLLPIACEYYGLDCFDPFAGDSDYPPAVAQRTLWLISVFL